MAGLRIGIDTGDSAQKIESMTSALDKLQNAGNAAAKSSAGVSSAAQREAKDIGDLASAINPLNKKLEELDKLDKALKNSFGNRKIDKDTYKDLQDDLDRSREKYAQMIESMRNGDFNSFIARIDPVRAALQRLREEEKKLEQYRPQLDTAQYDQYKNKLNEARAAIDGTTEARNRAKSAEQQEMAQLSAIRREIDPLGAATQELARKQAFMTKQFQDGKIGETEYQRSMQALRKETDQLTGSNQKNGLSSRQLAAANRMLPAQFTDIVVSLQGGQKPLTILFQQGGQIKDMYGGVANALKAVGKQAVAMINPWTIAAGAIIGVGAAAYSASQRLEDMNKKLTLSGRGGAGGLALAASEAKSLSESLRGVTINDASQAIAVVANNSKIASGDIEKVATAYLELSKVSKDAAKEMVDDFSTIAKDPVSAITALNDKYAVFNATITKQALAFHAAGKETEAATLLQKEYLSVIEKRAKDAADHLSPIAYEWQRISDATSDAINKALVYQGLGAKTTENELEKVRADMSRYINRSTVASVSLGMASYAASDKDEAYQKLKRREAELLEKQHEEKLTGIKEAANRDRQQKASAALIEDNKVLEAGMTKQEHRAQEIAKLNQRKKEESDAGTPMSDATYKKQVAAINERYKDEKKGSKAGFKAGEDALKNAQKAGQVLEAQYQAIKNGVTDSMPAAERALVEFNTKVKQIEADRASGKKLETADKMILSRKDAIRQQLEDNTLTEEGVRLQKERNDAIKKQREAHKKSVEEVRKIDEATALSSETRAMGSRETDRYNRRRKINDDPQLSSEDKKSQISALERSYKEADAAQADWSSAAKKAWSDFKADSEGVAGTVSNGMKSAFDQATNAMTNFITTGKLSFTDLLNTAANTAAKIGMQYASMALFGGGIGGGSASGATSMSSIASLVTGGMSFSKGGVVGKPKGYATGGHIKGEGTGTSDSIPAMLSNGEFVVNEAATRRHRGLLEAINNGGGTIARYAKGGEVGENSGAFRSYDSNGISLDMRNMTVHANNAEEGRQAAQAMSEQMMQILEQRLAKERGENRQFVVNQTIKSGGIINRQIKGR